MYLEQSLSKEQILELYLNIVELGPDVYGIGQASLHYFNTIPTTLSISQAVFLATILPHPVGIYFGQDKKLSPGRLAYVRRIIQLMFERKLISEEEYKEGMEEEPIFGSQKPQREGEAFTYTKGIDPSDWN
jgi:membrane peptidoglycan carboxypeptidase